MSLWDKAKDASQKGLDSAKKFQAEREEKQEQKASDLKARGILMQLKSSEGMVSLYDDHIETKSLLGGKVREIPYTQVHAVAMDKTSRIAKGTAAAMTFGASLAVTNKKTLVISTGIDKFKLDFRREPADRIEKALHIIKAHINEKTNPNVTVNVAGSGTSASSDADELAKLAKLKKQGILTEEEFNQKKKQILGL